MDPVFPGGTPLPTRFTASVGRVPWPERGSKFRGIDDPEQHRDKENAPLNESHRKDQMNEKELGIAMVLTHKQR